MIICGLSSGQTNLQPPIWGHGRQLDDRHRNPNINIREIIWLGNQLGLTIKIPVITIFLKIKVTLRKAFVVTIYPSRPNTNIHIPENGKEFTFDISLISGQYLCNIAAIYAVCDVWFSVYCKLF